MQTDLTVFKCAKCQEQASSRVAIIEHINRSGHLPVSNVRLSFSPLHLPCPDPRPRRIAALQIREEGRWYAKQLLDKIIADCIKHGGSPDDTLGTGPAASAASSSRNVPAPAPAPKKARRGPRPGPALHPHSDESPAPADPPQQLPSTARGPMNR